VGESAGNPVLAPSDLLGGVKPSDDELRLGARVEGVETDALLLADAGGVVRLRCEFAASERFSVGDLAVLVVRQKGDGWVATSVEYHECFAPPRGDGEWARFVWSRTGQRLNMRSRARTAMRHWFEAEGFLEVDTPAWLRAPGLDSDIDAVAAEHGWLVTSPELCMKRLLVGGLARVYQFAKCFRRDELGPRHEPEFTMLEWYRAYSDLARVLEDTEALVIAAAAAVGVGNSVEVNGRQVRLERPFMRLSVAEAFRRYAGIEDVDQLARHDRCRYFQLFVERVEPSLADYDRPLFLHDYPATEAALARLRADDPRWAERAELYVGGVELCNGYSELNSAVEQRSRFVAELEGRAAAGRPVYPIDERFLSALEQGMPPASGNALGFDRLMMVLLGAASIEQVTAFPRSQL
jgi:elongation factor P--(R)-beta-lysine ligase